MKFWIPVQILLLRRLQTIWRCCLQPKVDRGRIQEALYKSIMKFWIPMQILLLRYNMQYYRKALFKVIFNPSHKI